MLFAHTYSILGHIKFNAILYRSEFTPYIMLNNKYELVTTIAVTAENKTNKGEDKK